MANARFNDLGTAGDKRIWYLAWIGNVNQLLLNGSSSINLLLYPLRKGLTPQSFKGTKDDLILGDYKRVTVDVGLLASLKQGLLIQDDMVIANADSFLQSETFTLNIPKHHRFRVRPIKDFSNGKTVKNVNGEQREYPIFDFPLILFPFTRCLCIPMQYLGMASYDFVVIPCIEIIRFYFCTSERLAQALFTGGLHDEENTLFNPKSLTPNHELDTGACPFIYLRLRMLDSDAPIIARIAYSTIAMSAARSIYNVIRQNNINENLLEPISYFPFDGISTLNVVGTTITASGNGDEFVNKKIFLVSNILTCSGEFPFSELEFDREGNNQQGINKDDPHLPSSGWKPNQKESETFGNVNITSQEPIHHNPKRISLKHLEHRFLNCPPFQKKQKIFQSTKAQAFTTPLEIEPTSFSTAPESSDNPSAGSVHLAALSHPLSNDERVKAQSHTPDEYETYFRDLIRKFEDTNLKIEFLQTDDSGYLHFNPSVYRKGDESYKWTSAGFDRRKGGWFGKRPLLAVRFSNAAGHQFMLFDWIKRQTEQSGGQILFLYNSRFSALNAQMISQVIETCGYNQRIWLHENQLKEFERHYFDHHFKYGPDTTYRTIHSILQRNGFLI